MVAITKAVSKDAERLGHEVIHDSCASSVYSIVLYAHCSGPCLLHAGICRGMLGQSTKTIYASIAIVTFSISLERVAFA